VGNEVDNILKNNDLEPEHFNHIDDDLAASDEENFERVPGHDGDPNAERRDSFNEECKVSEDEHH